MKVGVYKLPKWGYSTIVFEPEKVSKASGRELRTSPKHAREVCNTLKGMKLGVAKEFLELVILKKKAVPFKRYNKKMPHRKGLNKSASGRYPVKAAKHILSILEGAEANAFYKGLDIENLRIYHASAYPGRKLKRFFPRAMGRSSPRNEILCHVEIMLKQIGDEI